MAFIRQRNQQADPNLGSSMYSEGGSAIAGGESSQTVAPGRTNTKAATPGSWYNIQDFLKANQSALPGMQKDIKDRAQGIIDKDKQTAQSNIESIQGLERPTGFGFDQNIAASGTSDEIRSGLTQDFDPYNYDPFKVQENELLSGLQPGSFGSVQAFNRATQDNKPGYTSGMSKMDEALLGSDASFAKEMPQWTKNTYQTQVKDPLQQTIETYQQKDLKADQAVEEAKNQWWSGVQGFMGNQGQSVEDALASQRSTYDKAAGKSATDVLSSAFGGKAPNTDFGYLDWGNYVNKYAGDYANFAGADPTRETAAMSALGQQGIDQYNMIANLLGGLDPNASYDALSGRDYTAPSWDVDTAGFKRQYERSSANAELEDKVLPSLESADKTINKYKGEYKALERMLDDYYEQRREAQRKAEEQGYYTGAGQVVPEEIAEAEKRFGKLDSILDDAYGARKNARKRRDTIIDFLR